MKIDRFNLYIVMVCIIAIETAIEDGIHHAQLLLFGLGPEGIVGAAIVRLLGWWFFRED